LKRFSAWFTKTYGTSAPGPLLNYIKDYPEGLAGQSELFKADEIIDATEQRALQDKGLLYIGIGPLSNVFLLRASDGKVFLVDRDDFKVVDASFKSLDACLILMRIGRN
jgi:hypothetical protein